MVLSTDSAGLYKSRVVQKRRALISVCEKVRRMQELWNFEFEGRGGENHLDAGKDEARVSSRP